MPASANDIAISIEGLGKRYRIGEREPYKTLRDTLTSALHAPARWLSGSPAKRQDSESRYIWALRNASLEVHRGEVVGVIGANGAGKSTLLKLLTRITEPTEGRAVIRGRVGSLLEVGTGFHPELTGRENVFMAGALLGMRRAEITRRFDEIVAFAGVEQFIDTPVKRYSSGMQVRLGFSVAAHLDTEILLVDEVLAVGDAAFQLQSLKKMSEVTQTGKTILLISHNMETITRLCGRALLLEKGRVAFTGAPLACVEQYLGSVRQSKPGKGERVSLENFTEGMYKLAGPVQLTSFEILDGSGQPAWDVPSGEPFIARIGYRVRADAPRQAVNFAITIANLQNTRIASCRSHDTHIEPFGLSGSGFVVCRIPRLPLRPGTYKVHLSCHTPAGYSHGVYDVAIFDVYGTGFYPSGQVPVQGTGEALFDHDWTLDAGEGIAWRPASMLTGVPRSGGQ